LPQHVLEGLGGLAHAEEQQARAHAHEQGGEEQRQQGVCRSRRGGGRLRRWVLSHGGHHKVANSAIRAMKRGLHLTWREDSPWSAYREGSGRSELLRGTGRGLR